MENKQALISEREQLLSKGNKISNYDLKRLNYIQDQLRRRNVENAPRYVKSVKGTQLRATSRGGSAGKSGEDITESLPSETTSQFTPQRRKELRRAERYETAQEQKALRQQQAQPTGQPQQGLTQEQADILNEKRRQASLSLFGIKPVASKVGGGELVQISGYRGLYSSQEKEIGTNIKQTSYNPFASTFSKQFITTKTQGKQEKSTNFIKYLYGTKEKATTGYKTYEYEYTTETQTNFLGTKATVTKYTTTSKNPFVQLGASLKTIGGIYNPVQEQTVQKNPYVGTAIKGGLFTSDLTFSGADILAGTIANPKARIFTQTFTRGVTNTAKPFIESSIKDPVLTYAFVRGPKIFGKGAYRILDYADVSQSVVTEGAKGYLTGGVTGAISGGVGGFVGEKISDKSAFYTAGKPPIPTFTVKTKGSYRPLIVTPTFETNEPQFMLDIISPTKFKATPLFASDVDISFQYQPMQKRTSEILSTPIKGSFTTKKKLVSPLMKVETLYQEGKIDARFNSDLVYEGKMGTYRQDYLKYPIYANSKRKPKRILPRITLATDLTPSEAQLTASHELVHYYTPKNVLNLGRTLPYRLQPAEILAFGLEKPLNKIGFPAKVKIQNMRTVKYNYLIKTERPDSGLSNVYYTTKSETLPSLKVTRVTDLTPQPKRPSRKVNDMFKGSIRKRAGLYGDNQLIPPSISQKYPSGQLTTQLTQGEADIKRPTLSITQDARAKPLYATPRRFSITRQAKTLARARLPTLSLMSLNANRTKPITEQIISIKSQTIQRTQSISRTATFTQTKSPTFSRTQTITVTRTPTLTPKIDKLFSSSSQRGINTRKQTKIYTPSITALFKTRNIFKRGKKSTGIGVASGLGVRF